MVSFRTQWHRRIDSTLDTKLKVHFLTALKRVKLAGVELEKVARGQSDANPDIRAVALNLFDQADLGTVATKLQRLNTGAGGVRISDKHNDKTMDGSATGHLRPDDVVGVANSGKVSLSIPNETDPLIR